MAERQRLRKSTISTSTVSPVLQQTATATSKVRIPGMWSYNSMSRGPNGYVAQQRNGSFCLWLGQSAFLLRGNLRHNMQQCKVHLSLELVRTVSMSTHTYPVLIILNEDLGVPLAYISNSKHLVSTVMTLAKSWCFKISASDLRASWASRWWPCMCSMA